MPRIPTRQIIGIAGAVAICSALLVDSQGLAGAAPVVAEAGGPYQIVEGGSLLLDGSASTGPPTTWNWDLDNDGQYDDASGVNPTIPWTTLSALGLGDDGSYQVGLEASDGLTASTDSATLTISNAAPAITVSGSGTAQEGLPYVVTVSVSDPGADTILSWAIAWGDGTIETGPGAPGTRSHVYALAGFTRDVRVSVTDEDGTFSPDDVIVPFWNATDKIGRFDLAGNRLADLDTSSPIDSAYGATIGPDGFIYVGGHTSNSIERYDPSDNSHAGTFVSPGSGGLSGPRGLRFGPDGNFYVVSSGTDEVLRYDGTSGAFIDVFVAAPGPLTTPRGLTFGPDGNLYVTDGGSHDVDRFDGATGAYLGAFADTPSLTSGMSWGPNGNLFVAVYGADQVREYDGTTGADLGQFIGGIPDPGSLEFGPDGALWVTSWATDQVHRYDATTGAYLDTPITEPAPARPHHLAFTGSHQVYVQQITVVNSTGDSSDTAPGDGACDTGGVNSEGAPECTLRAAIEESNASPATTAVHFGVPTTDPGYSGTPLVWTLTPGSPYDQMTAPIVLDARTQPGYGGDPVIELDGSGAAGATAGLDLVTDDSLIAGFIVHSFADDGIEVDGITGAGQDNVIVNNWVGFDASGIARGNVDHGILLTAGARRNTVGGTSPQERNVVGGNDAAGIAIRGPGTDENVIIGNWIGLAPDGVTPVPNGSSGVFFWDQPSHDNRVGGPAAGEGNTIVNNTGAGVTLASDTGTGNSVIGNSIHSNGGAAIDLGDDGTTPNDPGDVDTGPNDLLNHPVITSIEAAEGNVKVLVDLDVPAGDYRLEFFSNPSGGDEAEILAGVATVTHLGTGTESFSHTFAGAAGDVITATATQALASTFGSTSELSGTWTASPSPLTITKTSDAAGSTAPGDTITYTIVATNTGPTTYDAVAVEDVVPVGTTFVSSSVVHSVTLTARDDFDAVSYANDDGDPIWGGPWVETGDDGTAAAGTVQVEPDVESGSQLALNARKRSVSLERPVDLTGSTFAQLSFDYWIYELTQNNQEVTVEVWDGAIWTPLVTFDDTWPATTVAWETWTADITPYASAATQIAIRTGSHNLDTWGMNIDNLSVLTVGGPSAPGDPPPVVASGYSLDPGESLIVTYVVTVDDPPGVGQIDNTATLTSDTTPPQTDATTDLLYQYDVSGHVYEDVDGDGDVFDDGLVGAELVDVELFVDDGNGVPDGGDPSVGTAISDPAGGWMFNALSNGTYWLAVDSTDVAPSAGFDTGFGLTDVWADQSYATAGGATFDGASWSFSSSAGPLHGGARPHVSDAYPGLAGAQHITRVVVADGDVTEVDTGFTFASVNNTNDGSDPQGSLRQAIENSNAITGTQAPSFNLPVGDPGYAAGVWAISPTSGLPAASDSIVLDATVQPGWASTPVIELDGTLAGITDGLILGAGSDASTIRGLAIGSFGGDGLQVDSNSNSIVGNHIGADATGWVARGNAAAGIRLNGTANQVGGPAAADANVVAANGVDAIRVVGETGDTNEIRNNLLNLAVDGVTALAGSGAAVSVIGGADDTMIDGNRVGPSRTGIDVSGPSSGTIIVRNHLGTDPTRTAAHQFDEAAVNLAGGAFDNMIGGPGVDDGNVITGAGAVGPVRHGIRIAADAGSGNSVLRNAIYANSGLGIDLATPIDPPTGVTPNDPDDADVGPNDLLNHPVLTAATSQYGSVVVQFELDAPAGSYRVELFTNPSGIDPSGSGEAESFAAATTIIHTGSGIETFAASFPGSAGVDITASATEQLGVGVFGSSSELSAALAVIGGGTPVLDSSVRRSDLTGAGGLDPGSTVPGVVGPALDFDGGNDQLVGPAVDITAPALTMSGWVELDGFGTDPRVVAKSSSEGITSYELLVDSGTVEAVARVTLNGTTYEARGGVVAVGTPTHLAGTWDGSVLRVHVDGVEVGATAASGALSVDVDRRLIVGNVADGSRGLDGRIDEVRVLDTAIDPGRLTTSHANQSDPAGFISVGTLQTNAPGAWTVSGTQTRSGSFALSAPETLDGADAWLSAIGIDEPGIEFETWWWFSTAAGIDLAAGTRTGAIPIQEHETAITSVAGWDLGTQNGSSRSQDVPAAGLAVPKTWVKVVIRTDQNGRSSVVVDGSELIAPTAQTGLGPSGSVGLRVGQLPTSESWYVDDARVRRLVSPEPTTTISGIDSR